MVDARLADKVMAQGISGGLMRFTPPSKMAELEQGLSKEDTQDKQSTPEIINLASHIRKAWVRNRDAKREIEDEILKCHYRRRGEYNPDEKAKIAAQGGSDVFINITAVKCRATEAWLFDISLPAGERPFNLEPTPLPDLDDAIEQELAVRISTEYKNVMMEGVQLGTIQPDQIPEMMEQIKHDIKEAIQEKAEKDTAEFEDEIDDELVEGGFYEAVRKVIPDIVTLPAGIIHGPVVYRKKVLDWSTYPDGTPYATVSYKPVRQYRRVNPFDIYPSPGATSLDDGDLIERMRLARSEVSGFIGSPGFDDDAVRLVLQEYGTGGLREWLTNDLERQEAENRPMHTNLMEDGKIDCLKFMGKVQGAMLLQWGMSADQVPDPLAEYEITAYMIGRYVIKAKLNDDPLDKRNYFATSFEKSNDSVWGKGVPQLMEDIQRICNAAARALVNNMGHASGPMVWFYGDMIEGLPPTRVMPWMMLNMKTKPGQTGQTVPMGHFQPSMVAEQLLRVFEYFFKQASEVTGVPAYIYGSDQAGGGAADTASGLSMLMNAASKGLKAVAKNIDDDMIKKAVQAHWLHIMVNEPERAKGDINVIARASEYLLQQEQLQVRRAEFLKGTNNPTDLQIMGIDGRAEVLRETAKSLKMQTNKIVPERREIADMKQTNEMQQMFQNISNASGVPLENIMAMAKGMQPAQTGKPEALGPDGRKVAGQEQGRLMQ